MALRDLPEGSRAREKTQRHHFPFNGWRDQGGGSND
jgi:hypothetical protein